jgi:Cellulase M and related proteins
MNQNTLKTLCSLPGISGREVAVRAYILSEITPYCQNVDVDNLGNIIAFVKGENPRKSKLLLAAHMDEVGLIITAKEGGFYRFAAVGGIDAAVLPAKRVRCGEHVGVIGAVPVHLQKDKGMLSEISDMFIDFGGAEVEIGSSVVFESDSFDISENLSAGRAIDDRFGCAVLIDIIKAGVEFDASFAFTVQEELGCRGAKTVAMTVKPDVVIVVETTTAADTPDAKSDTEKVCELGKGACVPFMDKGVMYDSDLYKLAETLAHKNRLCLQTKHRVAGGNDASALAIYGGGAKVLAVSLPCRNLHSPCVIWDKRDAEIVEALVTELLKTI